MHLTSTLCRTVFRHVRISERQRVRTLEALVRFWTVTRRCARLCGPRLSSRPRIEVWLELQGIGDLGHRIEELNHLDGFRERAVRQPKPTCFAKVKIDAIVRLSASQ